MRVLMASKALVVGAYQRKLEEIAAQPGVERLVAVVPPSWQEPGGRRIALERVHTRGYELRVEPIRLDGHFHVFHWPGLGRVLRETRPDVVHVDEEPYNLAALLATWQARRAGARAVFFTWQNLRRHYPPPFSLFEQVVYRLSAHAIAGSAEAAAVLRAKGYRGPVSVIPQVGVDPAVFAPAEFAPAEPGGLAAGRAGDPAIGFVGRLVEEKGLLVLLEALGGLDAAWRLHLVGSGPLGERLRAEAAARGLGDRLTWEASVPSSDVPERLRTFDVVVLPSLTRPNWKEQFGRALVEAMACQVAVVGSSSGEIPHVVGDAGLIVPEGDPEALREALRRLLGDPGLRAELGRRGRARVLAHFTHRRIAEQTVAVYRSVASGH